MDCCDPAVTRSWRLFRKRFVHIQENCSDFSPRLYSSTCIVGTPPTTVFTQHKHSITFLPLRPIVHQQVSILGTMEGLFQILRTHPINPNGLTTFSKSAAQLPRLLMNPPPNHSRHSPPTTPSSHRHKQKPTGKIGE